MLYLSTLGTNETMTLFMYANTAIGTTIALSANAPNEVVADETLHSSKRAKFSDSDQFKKKKQERSFRKVFFSNLEIIHVWLTSSKGHKLSNKYRVDSPREKPKISISSQMLKQLKKNKKHKVPIQTLRLEMMAIEQVDLLPSSSSTPIYAL